MTRSIYDALIDELHVAAEDLFSDDVDLANDLLRVRRGLLERQRRNVVAAALHRIESALGSAVAQLSALQRSAAESAQREVDMSAELERVQASVAAENTVIGGAVSLLQQLGDLVRNTQPTAEALNALADDIDARKAELAAAIAANTPAA